MIPAVQSRLHDLLSHNSSVGITFQHIRVLFDHIFTRSPHVRRRALLAFRALSNHDPELMKRVVVKMQKRLRDADPAVVGAALVVSADAVGGSI